MPITAIVVAVLPVHRRVTLETADTPRRLHTYRHDEVYAAINAPPALGDRVVLQPRGLDKPQIVGLEL
jgi:hypothetical protein